jgi:hypothetical protein
MTQVNSSSQKSSLRTIIYDLLLIAIILAGAYFRLVGYQWGEYNYLHPDERFLLMVASDISPIKQVLDPEPGQDQPRKVWIGLAEYFDTANSPLNPNNRGHGFYVYGTLPLFMARFLAELNYEHVGLQEIQDVGRPLSALTDLLVVLVVYLIAARLYNRRVGLLASAFYAAAVLPIQLSHFYKEDTFTNLFLTLAIYFAVLVMKRGSSQQSALSNQPSVISDQPGASDDQQSAGGGRTFTHQASRIILHPYFLYSPLPSIISPPPSRSAGSGCWKLSSSWRWQRQPA